MEKEQLTISEMAKLHNISRQTLIYYDKNKIFQPKITNENGYRFYTPDQIPFLREICFLKAIGVKLEDINTHIYTRNDMNIIDFMVDQEISLDHQIAQLERRRESIRNRLKVYDKALSIKEQINQPQVVYMEERKIIFIPWDRTSMNRRTLHLTLMRAWNEMEKYGMFVENGWGSMIQKEQIDTEEILKNAGGYANLPGDIPLHPNMRGVIILPAGEYLCMAKYGMPYEEEHLHRFIKWMKEHNYTPLGNIIDACYQDRTFYDENQTADLCQLQVCVKIGKREDGIPFR